MPVKPSDEYHFQIEELNNLLDKDDYEGVSVKLTSFAENLDSKKRNISTVEESVIEVISSVLTKYKKQFKKSTSPPINVLSCVTECFRCFRNACVKNTTNQTVLLQNSNILTDTVVILEKILIYKKLNENLLSCLRCGLQFLGNAIVSHHKNQSLVWENAQVVLCDTLEVSDEKSVNYALMVIYNVLIGCQERKIMLPGFPQKTHVIMERFAKLYKDSEYAVWCLEILMCETTMLLDHFSSLTVQTKLIILDNLLYLLQFPHMYKTEESKLNIEIIIYFVNEYKNQADSVLSTLESSVNVDSPVVICRLLEFLSSASSVDCFRPYLQDDKGFLTTTVYLLKNLHELSKRGVEKFDILNKLSQLNIKDSNNATIENTATYGFKRSLVRIIANLVYQHKENQDEVRELECIPVLLDCCSMDARNPFITEWIIITIRNLCENNSTNQKIISSVSATGQVNDSILNQTGIIVNKEGNKTFLKKESS